MGVRSTLCLTPRQAKHLILVIDTHLASRLDIVPSSVSVVSLASSFPFTHLLLLLLLRLHGTIVLNPVYGCYYPRNERISDSLNLAHGAQYHFLQLACFLTKFIHLTLQVMVFVHPTVHGLAWWQFPTGIMDATPPFSSPFNVHNLNCVQSNHNCQCDVPQNLCFAPSPSFPSS